MPESYDSIQQKRKDAVPRSGGERAGERASTQLLITFGLAAMVTGIFTIAGDFLKSWQSAYEQRCAIAQQVVLDESPSPALKPAQRSRLNDQALHKVELCMGESG
jgi:hypothetical protein